jgi:hypothetical protein
MNIRSLASGKTLTILTLAASVSLLGCGTGADAPPPTTVKTVPVSGTVTVQGKPFRGEGYQVMFIGGDGSASMASLNNSGKFSGSAPTGSVKAAVAGPGEIESAHGDPSSVPNTVTVTIAEGGSADLKIDLPSAPKPLPKPGAGAGGGHHGS